MRNNQVTWYGVQVVICTGPLACLVSGLLLVGYRWYDAQDIEPLFPFGHGLSYTVFEYSDLTVAPSGDGYDVSFFVGNVGQRKGAEVAQVYLGPAEEPKAAMAPRKLVGFERTELVPGPRKQITVHLGERELSYWSTEEHQWTVAAGRRPVYVGASSRDIRLQGTLE